MKAKTKSAPRVQTPLRIGNAVFIRTITHYFTGRIVGLTKDEILLTDAAWIACTARWATTLTTGELQEVEPYPNGMVVSVARGAVTDACAWSHALPRAQK